MKKLHQKDEVWFAVLWIVVYVAGFGNADMLSESIGMPKAITAGFGLILSAVLGTFVYRNGLGRYYGLCRFRGDARGVLYWIPLAVITSVNLWNGVAVRCGLAECAFHILSMCCVGFLEELIFRGFLFRGMCKSNVKAAIIVSSLTFGVGHAVNLLLGEPLFDTLLQLVYAAAIGFYYTAVFYTGGSLIPCILSHAIVNSTSIFAVETSAGMSLLAAAVQTVICIGCGAWLLKSRTAKLEM